MCRPFPFTWERLLTTPGGVCHACTSRLRPDTLVPRHEVAGRGRSSLCLRRKPSAAVRVLRIARTSRATKLARPMPVLEWPASAAAEFVPLFAMPIVDAPDMAALVAQVLVADGADQFGWQKRGSRGPESLKRPDTAHHLRRGLHAREGIRSVHGDLSGS